MSASKFLDVSGGKFSDADIQLLCTNKGLESLRLEQCPDLTDEALRELGNLVNLKELIVPGNKTIGDKSCDQVARCIALRYLEIGGTEVSDRGVEKLMVLRQLEDLGLSGTRITAKSIERLTELPKLRCLGIFENNNLGDEIVPLIKRYKSLESLLCMETKLSLEGQKELAMSRKWKTLWPPPDEGIDPNRTVQNGTQ